MGVSAESYLQEMPAQRAFFIPQATVPSLHFAYSVLAKLPMIGNSANASLFATMADYFRELERSRIRALVTADIALLRQLHAPDYQLITPPGRAWTRERYLRAIEDGDLRYVQWTPDAIDVRTSSHMAIVRYQAVLELDSGNGSGTPFKLWHTDSYELRGDRWQAMWSQATAIRDQT